MPFPNDYVIYVPIHDVDTYIYINLLLYASKYEINTEGQLLIDKSIYIAEIEDFLLDTQNTPDFLRAKLSSYRAVSGFSTLATDSYKNFDPAVRASIYSTTALDYKTDRICVLTYQRKVNQRPLYLDIIFHLVESDQK